MAGMRPSHPNARSKALHKGGRAVYGTAMNDDSEIPQFGSAMPGLIYGERPSAYGVAVNAAGRVLVCRRSRGRILLPGGGLHAGESPHEAMVREVGEETAHRVLGASEIGRARQYHSHRISKPPVNKFCHFYAIDVAHDPLILSEDDHQAVWLSPHDLVSSLTSESHRWALERHFHHRRRG